MKTLIIPAGFGCACLQRFADALASTTADPARQISALGNPQQVQLGAGSIANRSFAEVVSLGSRSHVEQDLRSDEEPGGVRIRAEESQDEIGVSIWGLEPKHRLSILFCNSNNQSPVLEVLCQ